jgi:acyl-CoA oxidase
MKYAKVAKNGEFTKAMNEKIGYATMMQVRTSILRASYSSFQLGLTVAVRYSLKRTQFKDANGQEQVIFEYQTQQDKITPLLADCVAMVFGEHKVDAITHENIKRINERMDFSLMQDLHALVSSCKAIYTWQTYFGLEKLR